MTPDHTALHFCMEKFKGSQAQHSRTERQTQQSLMGAMATQSPELHRLRTGGQYQATQQVYESPALLKKLSVGNRGWLPTKNTTC
ncbi:hypothetical protein I79_023950 [Cricetulus griseus]|uniref:Uncharacterized protein n=1 Tax=Cricetulus griseus TaxID=10029 RepID=G3IJB7_CRIGR|nr:hypothetical protein I79_023950 [Cricetulus griseus]